jgi:1-acyl-sn-glycerol-3-phosphate acyltransferase
MTGVFRRFAARHLDAVRVSRRGLPDRAGAVGPVVVYSNHPSWWDAAAYVLLADAYFRDTEAYAPIDAEMLAAYGVFGRIGAFGVDLSSAKGAADFLSASADVLSAPGRSLWVAAQGRFVDARVRPPGLRPGVSRLAEIAPGAVFLPLALEYPFWTERGAEALAAFGPPVPGADLAALPRDARLERMERDLAATMDRLAEDAMSRDPSRFVTLQEGRAGVGGIYDLWRRAKAMAAGRRFDPAHMRDRGP